MFTKEISESNIQDIGRGERSKTLTQTPHTNRIGLRHPETFWRFQGWGLLVLIVLSFYPTQFHYQEYLFFTLLILAIGVSLIEGQTIWIRTPLDWPILLLIGWVLITIPFAVDQAHSFTEWRKLAGRFLVFYWTLLVFQRQRQDQFVLHVSLAVLVGALSISGYAIWDFLERGGTLVHRGVRAVAPSSHSHWLGTYLVMAWPIVFFLLMSARQAWKHLLLLCILLLITVAEFLSFSRGAWIAIVLQIGFAAFVFGGRRIGLGVVVGIVICGIGLWSISQQGYIEGVFEFKSMADRLGCWQLGMNEILAQPVFGVGFGNDTFAEVYPGDPPGECTTGSSLPTGAHLHNTLLMFAMGSGIPAFIFLFWILVKGLKVLVGEVKLSTAKGRDTVRAAIGLMLVGFWTCAFFNYLFTGSLAYLFMLLLACGMWRCGKVGLHLTAKDENFEFRHKQ